MKQYWAPHPLDEYDQWFLLEIAESANPPDTQRPGAKFLSGEMEFPAKDGWRVVFFYDCGNLDYIDHFLMPDGKKLNVLYRGYKSECWPPVMSWRGVGDLDRIRLFAEKNG